MIHVWEFIERDDVWMGIQILAVSFVVSWGLCALSHFLFGK